MELLVTYDVDTTTTEGQRRLRRVAKVCEGIGHRVQKSVFEIICSGAQRLVLEAQLREIIDPIQDSIRVYRLDAGTFGDTAHLGAAIHAPHRGPIIV